MSVFTEEIPEERQEGSLQMFLQMSLKVIASVAKESQDSFCVFSDVRQNPF